MNRHPDITITEDIEKFLFDIEYKIWKFFHIKIPRCGHYERYEQCCNDFREVYNYCDYMCFYGISGCKRLLLSNMFFHIVRLINKVINKLRGNSWIFLRKDGYKKKVRVYNASNSCKR